MKQCPKCSNNCQDSDIVCKNCGYLFPADSGMPDGNPGNSSGNPQNGLNGNPQGGFNGNPQGGFNGNPQGGFNGNPQGGLNGNPQGGFNVSPQGGFNGNPQGNPENQRTDGMSLASFILGIIGIVTSCCAIGWIPGIISLIFGIISKKHEKLGGLSSKSKAFATAGIVLAIISIVFGLIILIYCIAYYPEIQKSMQEALNKQSQYGM